MNAIERGIVLTRTDYIDSGDMPLISGSLCGTPEVMAETGIPGLAGGSISGGGGKGSRF